MGAGGSKAGGVGTRDAAVFEPELRQLRARLGKVLGPDGASFLDPHYNLLSEQDCKGFRFVTQSELGRHMKLSIGGEQVYVIPKSDLRLPPHRRAAVCQRVVAHYTRILYVLRTVAEAYDLDGMGDMSIAGIVARNVRVADGMLDLAYCRGSHRGGGAEAVDLGELRGMRLFVQGVLTGQQADAFMRCMRAALGRSWTEPSSSVLACALQSRVPAATRAAAKHFQAALGVGARCAPPPSDPLSGGDRDGSRRPLDLSVRIAPTNAVFGSKLCYEAGRVLVRLDSQQGKAVKRRLGELVRTYRESVAQAEALVARLVAPSGELRDVSSGELDAVLADLKLAVAALYLQSVLRFQALLDAALQAENVLAKPME